LLDRNAPENLTDTPQKGYDDSKALIKTWHGRGRALYAITPRFAVTSTPEQMEMTGTLAAEHPDCYIQTHLSENHDEIALTAKLYPQTRDYLDVYQSYGLLGPRTLMGHALHLKDREIAALAETGTHPVFCPTSNLFLGSGLFDDAKLREHGIVNGIATDIGGGTSYSMLQTLSEGYKALHLDIVILDAHATEAMAMRMARAETLSEELFVLQMMGDDRSIAETYINGEPQKVRSHG